MPKTIWIVDDDRDTADLIEFILTAQDYVVKKFVLANDFLVHRDELPDLYIMDKWFDGLDGLMLCRELKINCRTKHLPVLMVSAVHDIEDRARQYCADGAIAKPFEMKMLLDTVAKLLSAANAVI